MKNTAQTPSTQAEAAAERFALRVTARLSSGTEALPYDISERLRASRMQALAKRKVTVPVRRTAPAAVVVNAGSTATLGRGGEGGGWWNALVSASENPQCTVFEHERLRGTGRRWHGF